MQTGAAAVESSREVTQKIKNETVLWPSNSIFLKKSKTLIWKTINPYVDCNVIYNSQDIEATQVLINRPADKKWWYMYTMEYYSALKK